MKKEKEVNETKENKNSKLWLFICGIVIIILIVLLLLHSCGNGKKYKITLHYGDEVIEVDSNIKISDMEVEGGTISFLVDSDGHIVFPGEKLDPNKEYSAHIIPNGKETVKVTYKVDDKKNTVTYQKGSGLLFPDDPVKKGYVFIAWKYEDKDDYPIYMMPVEHDMTVVAVFEKSKTEGGKCTLNCDTNNDGKCDLNCDTNKDGKPDTNIDSDGDGKPDTNIDIDGDGKPDTNIDTNGDGKCDKDCKEYIFNDTFQDELYFDCEEIEMGNLVVYFLLNREDEFLYSKFNGKEAKPDGFDSDGCPYWNLDKYIELGKNIEVIVTFIKTDSTGQKYFITHHVTLVFEKNCDKKDSTEKENDIPSTDGNVLELNYNCDTPHGVKLYWEKDRIQSVTIDGKKATPGKYDEKNYPTYDLREYKGSGKTIYLNAKVTNNENKDYEFTVKLIFSKDCSNQTEEKETKTYTITFNADGGSVNPKSKTVNKGEKIGTLPTPTKDGYTFVGWYTSSGARFTPDTKISSNGTIYAHWTKKEEPQSSKPQDNGTISLSASKKCLVKGQSITITANVSNALDSSVDWLGDACLSISTQGNVATIRGNNCGVHPTVTGRLHNGSKDTITLDYEDTLTVTITDTSGNKVSPSDGVYYGNNLTITSNVSAYITGSYLSGDSGSLRTSAKTQGAAGTTVTVRTACGQTKSITISPIIN